MTATNSIPSVPVSSVRTTYPASAGTTASTFEATFRETSQAATDREECRTQNVPNRPKLDAVNRQQSGRPEKNFGTALQIALGGHTNDAQSAIGENGADSQSEPDAQDGQESVPASLLKEHSEDTQLKYLVPDQGYPMPAQPAQPAQLAEAAAARSGASVNGSKLVSESGNRSAVLYRNSLSAPDQAGLVPLSLEAGVISASLETHLLSRGVQGKFGASLASPSTAKENSEDEFIIPAENAKSIGREIATPTQAEPSDAAQEIGVASSLLAREGDAKEGLPSAANVAQQVAEVIAASSHRGSQGDADNGPGSMASPEYPSSGDATDLARNLPSTSDEIVRSLRMRLHPDSLGQVDVHLSMRGDEIRVRLRVENAGTAETFRSEHADLAQALSQHGLRLTEVVVDRMNMQGSGEQQVPGQSKSTPGFDPSGMSGGGSSSQRHDQQRPASTGRLSERDDIKSVALLDNDKARLGRMFV